MQALKANLTQHIVDLRSAQQEVSSSLIVRISDSGLGVPGRENGSVIVSESGKKEQIKPYLLFHLRQPLAS